MNIVIASGKGGTGKTLVSTNLAAVLSEKQHVQLLDCDVEAPNVDIFMNSLVETENPVNILVPEIDHQKCNLCNQCGQVCEFNAISVFGKQVLVFPELCHACGGCTIACPENAISEREHSTGLVKSGSSGSIKVYSGLLTIGEAKSPPVINAVKEYIDDTVINIIDSPPGTACPAVEAMRDSDYIILVAEDSPFGFNDLKLAVKVVKKLNTPFGIVLNKSDTNYPDVKNYAYENDIPIHIKIPLDRTIAELYSKGELLINSIPAFKLSFLKLFEQIENRLKS